VITRESALELIKKKVDNRNLIKHMLATEAIMSELAKRFGGDEFLWGLAGLVHDVDYKETEKTPEKHAIVGAEWLKELGYPEDVIHAVSCHNELTGVKRENKMDESLYTCDPLTGLIVACGLIHADKKLSSIDVHFVMKRFKIKRFAAGAKREQIQNCENIGIPLEEFIGLGLKAMQRISEDLGL
jgi:putative nucleotidyltransferase with HDIG domain